MSAVLGLYPGHRLARVAPPEMPGATAAQSGELARLQARYGRCRHALRSDGLLFVQAIGDAPLDGEKPLAVLVDQAGRVVWAQSGTRRIPVPSTRDPLPGRDLPVFEPGHARRR